MPIKNNEALKKLLEKYKAAADMAGEHFYGQDARIMTSQLEAEKTRIKTMLADSVFDRFYFMQIDLLGFYRVELMRKDATLQQQWKDNFVNHFWKRGLENQLFSVRKIEAQADVVNLVVQNYLVNDQRDISDVDKAVNAYCDLVRDKMQHPEQMAGTQEFNAYFDTIDAKKARREILEHVNNKSAAKFVLTDPELKTVYGLKNRYHKAIVMFDKQQDAFHIFLQARYPADVSKVDQEYQEYLQYALSRHHQLLQLISKLDFDSTGSQSAYDNAVSALVLFEKFVQQSGAALRSEALHQQDDDYWAEEESELSALNHVHVEEINCDERDTPQVSASLASVLEADSMRFFPRKPSTPRQQNDSEEDSELNASSASVKTARVHFLRKKPSTPRQKQNDTVFTNAF